MTLTEFISMIRDDTGTAVTRARIRELTNRAQNEILGVNCNLMRVKPDPFLATSDDTYSYVASTSIYDSSDGTQGSLVGDIREVAEIYSLNANVSIFDVQTLDPASDRPNQFVFEPTTEKVKMRFTCIPSVKVDNADCTIKIWEGNDPGDSTVDWRCVCYEWPDQLTSENIALAIPDGFQDTLLYYAVMKRITRREYKRNEGDVRMYEHYYGKFKSKYVNTASQDLEVAEHREF